MPAGTPPDIELQPSRSTSSTKLVTAGNTVSSAEVAFNVDGEKSQLQLYRAAELQKTRTATAAASTSQMQRSASCTLKYKERLTRARSTSQVQRSASGTLRGGKPGEESSEMAADLAKTAALVESALRSVG